MLGRDTSKLQIARFRDGFPVSKRAPLLPPDSHFAVNFLLWLEYNLQVVSYTRGDIGPIFAATYRLPLPKDAPFTIGYTFE